MGTAVHLGSGDGGDGMEQTEVRPRPGGPRPRSSSLTRLLMAAGLFALASAAAFGVTAGSAPDAAAQTRIGATDGTLSIWLDPVVSPDPCEPVRVEVTVATTGAYDAAFAFLDFVTDADVSVDHEVGQWWADEQKWVVGDVSGPTTERLGLTVRGSDEPFVIRARLPGGQTTPALTVLPPPRPVLEPTLSPLVVDIDEPGTVAAALEATVTRLPCARRGAAFTVAAEPPAPADGLAVVGGTWTIGPSDRRSRTFDLDARAEGRYVVTLVTDGPAPGQTETSNPVTVVVDFDRDQPDLAIVDRAAPSTCRGPRPIQLVVTAPEDRDLTDVVVRLDGLPPGSQIGDLSSPRDPAWLDDPSTIRIGSVPAGETVSFPESGEPWSRLVTVLPDRRTHRVVGSISDATTTIDLRQRTVDVRLDAGTTALAVDERRTVVAEARRPTCVEIAVTPTVSSGPADALEVSTAGTIGPDAGAILRFDVTPAAVGVWDVAVSTPGELSEPVAVRAARRPSIDAVFRPPTVTTCAARERVDLVLFTTDGDPVPAVNTTTEVSGGLAVTVGDRGGDRIPFTVVPTGSPAVSGVIETTITVPATADHPSAGPIVRRARIDFAGFLQCNPFLVFTTRYEGLDRRIHPCPDPFVSYDNHRVVVTAQNVGQAALQGTTATILLREAAGSNSGGRELDFVVPPLPRGQMVERTFVVDLARYTRGIGVDVIVDPDVGASSRHIAAVSAADTDPALAIDPPTYRVHVGETIPIELTHTPACEPHAIQTRVLQQETLLEAPDALSLAPSAWQLPEGAQAVPLDATGVLEGTYLVEVTSMRSTASAVIEVLPPRNLLVLIDNTDFDAYTTQLGLLPCRDTPVKPASSLPYVAVVCELNGVDSAPLSVEIQSRVEPDFSGPDPTSCEPTDPTFSWCGVFELGPGQTSLPFRLEENSLVRARLLRGDREIGEDVEYFAVDGAEVLGETLERTEGALPPGATPEPTETATATSQDEAPTVAATTQPPDDDNLASDERTTTTSTDGDGRNLWWLLLIAVGSGALLAWLWPRDTGDAS